MAAVGGWCHLMLRYLQRLTDWLFVIATRAKLVRNGLQSFTVETLRRFPHNEDVLATACALVLLLTSDTRDPTLSDSPLVGPPTIRPWPIRELVDLLTAATVGSTHSLAFEELSQLARDVLQCLGGAPQLSDVDESGTSSSEVLAERMNR